MVSGGMVVLGGVLAHGEVVVHGIMKIPYRARIHGVEASGMEYGVVFLHCRYIEGGCRNISGGGVGEVGAIRVIKEVVEACGAFVEMGKIQIQGSSIGFGFQLP